METRCYCNRIKDNEDENSSSSFMNLPMGKSHGESTSSAFEETASNTEHCEKRKNISLTAQMCGQNTSIQFWRAPEIANRNVLVNIDVLTLIDCTDSWSDRVSVSRMHCWIGFHQQAFNTALPAVHQFLPEGMLQLQICGTHDLLVMSLVAGHFLDPYIVAVCQLQVLVWLGVFCVKQNGLDNSCLQYPCSIPVLRGTPTGHPHLLCGIRNHRTLTQASSPPHLSYAQRVLRSKLREMCPLSRHNFQVCFA